MEDFSDKCLEGYMKLSDDGNPALGLRYLFASALYTRIKKEQSENAKIFWITVSPKEDVTFDTFQQVTDRFLSRVFVKNCAYTYEIRGKKDGSYYGYHVHMIMDKCMSPKQMYDRVKNTFKDLIGTSKAIDVRVYGGHIRQDKIAYIKGEKWDSEKDEAIKYTEEWREFIGLEQYYIKA